MTYQRKLVRQRIMKNEWCKGRRGHFTGVGGKGRNADIRRLTLSCGHEMKIAPSKKLAADGKIRCWACERAGVKP